MLHNVGKSIWFNDLKIQRLVMINTDQFDFLFHECYLFGEPKERQ
jgi:hypothetical protein